MNQENIEIERRFLLANEDWRQAAAAPKLLSQGYFCVEKECTIRVRIAEGRAWLTLKGYLSDVSRSEFEYEIPVAHARQMMETMCSFRLEKRRYEVEYQGFVFEVDEYSGENAPLIVAELELPSEQTDFPRPDWLGEEITSDARFTNAYLSRHPYSAWPSAA